MSLLLLFEVFYNNRKDSETVTFKMNITIEYIFINKGFAIKLRIYFIQLLLTYPYNYY
jgi:hypothetical protein